MDAKHFDDVLRQWGSSRRPVLGAGLGALLGLAGLELTEAKKKKRKKKKKKCRPNCTGRTCGDDGCGGSCGTCPARAICQGGVCGCPDNLISVGQRCVQPCLHFPQDSNCPAPGPGQGNNCFGTLGDGLNVAFCAAFQNPFCRMWGDVGTCSNHADCPAGQLCALTACTGICVTPSYSWTSDDGMHSHRHPVLLECTTSET